MMVDAYLLLLVLDVGPALHPAVAGDVQPGGIQWANFSCGQIDKSEIGLTWKLHRNIAMFACMCLE